MRTFQDTASECNGHVMRQIYFIKTKRLITSDTWGDTLLYIFNHCKISVRVQFILV